MLEMESGEGTKVELPEPLSSSRLKESLRTGVDWPWNGMAAVDDITVLSEECPILARPADLALIVEELVDNAFSFPVAERLSSSAWVVMACC